MEPESLGEQRPGERVSLSSIGGTGSRLARVVIILAGVCSLVATLLSIASIWLQTKNYRKPLLQRYVVRILLMVPIYAASSWTSIISIKAAMFLTPIRDVYEAFTIYTFFQLLINFVGGERALIIMTHGRPPVQHLWPLNNVLPKVDISDPHTFLAIKRGILQYAWLKPILALVSIIMKATGTYQEGYLGLTSGYMWTGLIYNVSVTVSLYSLALFWVCMHDDLKPFRPVPKFLCIKLILFASYWQGFFLSILQWLGAIPNGVAGYTPDNLAAAIQDSLICIEMPAFAISHWYAFSWHDFADARISAARMPVKYALRDAFGPKDLIEDSKQTFKGKNYEYRFFDSGDHIIAHEESSSRVKRVMEGMRYERGGKGKYWLPKPGEAASSRTPLLAGEPSSAPPPRRSRIRSYASYTELEETQIDEEDERLFAAARALEFGDWNYPVITANEVPRDQLVHASRPRLGPARSSTSGSTSSSSASPRTQKRARGGQLVDLGVPDEEDTTDKHVQSPTARQEQQSQIRPTSIIPPPTLEPVLSQHQPQHEEEEEEDDDETPKQQYPPRVNYYYGALDEDEHNVWR
ncbi:hypothetical protein VTN49DRAFT_1028 [Thermomyces lanuginosus]|uniref:uncharacterized protein n=1 Tax=Thermomyces lanuginosus TaxID=5541 RepID=UPI00374231E9